MTLGLEHTLPRFLIDDTSDITNARVFVVHTQEPRFIGELMPGDESEVTGITFSCSSGEVLCRIVWIDDPEFDGQELTSSLNEAVNKHWSIR